ncbi:MAG: LacI family DNA-binding transcriptional regulator [Xanthomonadales bacterium]|nr:LacI family DNA-binding transcriptional regulator [Gammaproteobacteria bacterium]MBT8055517.1 LacI family DNA-binding transcriptional regulator [Gammaproteobacteria bacterium]NNJ78376.1 LacI family DNA-binding transcriptional regulator [Xanthomonadales bacterium]NNL03665.1 LacI family DNA-binding transcriptional regulator [Xanthomonadales bacterium]
MGSGKTTSFDIAKRAGVSQATVSRALRNSPLVNPETREKVQRIAREMNYRVDRSAAGLRSQRSNTIALLFFEDPTSDDSQINPFFLTLLGHITRYATRQSYDVLVSFQQLSDDWLNEYVVSNRADGIILLGYGDYGRISDKLQRLREEGLPFTIWGATVPELEGHAIGCDNPRGGELATRHLLGIGRRRVAYIGSASDDAPEFKLRYQGYCRALEKAAIEPDPQLLMQTDNLELSAYDATQKLLDSGVEFDAIFAASDLIAFGVIKCLKKNNIAIPDQVSLVGFDDLPAATYFSPALTTVRQDTRLAAHALMGNLLKMIEGEDVTSPRIPISMVVRGSCGGRQG